MLVHLWFLREPIRVHGDVLWHEAQTATRLPSPSTDMDCLEQPEATVMDTEDGTVDPTGLVVLEMFRWPSE